MNECISTIHCKLQFNISKLSCEIESSIKFVYKTEAIKHLGFITNWNGINLNQAKSMPKSLKEYENRSKNWLNGRRAPNYAKTLFPEMIHAVKKVWSLLFLFLSVCAAPLLAFSRSFLAVSCLFFCLVFIDFVVLFFVLFVATIINPFLFVVVVFVCLFCFVFSTQNKWQKY